MKIYFLLCMTLKSAFVRPIFRIPLRSLQFLSPHSSPSVLLSLSLTHPSSSSSSPPPPSIYETASPAAIETLSHFLDQQGGHDVVFCFPNEAGRELYADRYVLQRCSPYFRSLFGTHPNPDHTHVQPLNDRDHNPQNRSPNAGSAGMGSPSSSVRSRGTPDGSERDITTTVLTPLTSVAGDSNLGGPKEADPARIPLPPDGSGLLQPGKFQNQVGTPCSGVYAIGLTISEQRAPTPMMGDNVFVMNVNETSYNTFRAFLYYLYTGFISFAPLTSSFQIPTSDIAPTEMERRRLDARNAMVGDYMRKYRNRPVPVSPKSIFAVAKKYELPVLEVCRITFDGLVTKLTSECAGSSTVKDHAGRSRSSCRNLRTLQRVHPGSRNCEGTATRYCRTKLGRYCAIEGLGAGPRERNGSTVRLIGIERVLLTDFPSRDAYFASVLCEILERLPARSR